jgi:hypothetical protein
VDHDEPSHIFGGLRFVDSGVLATAGVCAPGILSIVSFVLGGFGTIRLVCVGWFHVSVVRAGDTLRFGIGFVDVAAH